MNTIIFPVKRFPPEATDLRHVADFIQEHSADRAALVVEIDRAGVGSAFADYLERAGFTVKRVP